MGVGVKPTIALLPILFVAAAAMASCGGSNRPSPSQVARQTVESSYRGAYAKVYAALYPAQKDVISPTAYTSCLQMIVRQTRAFGYQPATARFAAFSVAKKTTRMTVPGTHKVVQATLVEGRLTFLRSGTRVRVGGGREIDLARVGGRWYYIDPICPIVSQVKEVLGSEFTAKVPGWARKEGFQHNPVAIVGAKLFAVSGCLNCHSYNGSGGHNLGAPDLTAEGAKHRSVTYEIAHLKCPSCVKRGSPMPVFSALGQQRLKQIAVFLVASKGE